jgi:hypothetical protein
LAILSDTSEPAEQVDACKRTCARFPWRVHVCIILPMRQMSVCDNRSKFTRSACLR